MEWMVSEIGKCSDIYLLYTLLQINIPAPSKGWCLNPKGLLSGTPYHPFGTPWRVQVYIYMYIMFVNCYVCMIRNSQLP